MWVAGRWGAARPPSDAWFPADCGARSRPSSGPVPALTANARGQGALEAARSPSPPQSYSNSTRSLLSPLCHQSFAFDDDDDDDGDAADEEEVDGDAHDSEAQGASPGGVELRGRAR